MNGRKGRRQLASLYRAALKAVDPAAGVARALAEPRVAAALSHARRLGVFAVGKAAAGMLSGLGSRAVRGLAILPRGFAGPASEGVEVLFSSHPEPDRSSLAAARRALAFFRSFGREDLLLCLISGGASSLLCLPRAGQTLRGKRSAVAKRMRSGASILEVNRLRTRLSAVKGGRLGRATPARLVTLVLSDVPGDRASAVGSGPTVRGLKGDLVRIIGTNAMGLAGAAAQARRLGLVPRVRHPRLSGEAPDAGRRFGREAGRLEPGEALLAGGETTVSLGSRAGRGGRNLEFALAAGLAVAGAPGLVLLCAGSDGRDGSSDAAGAFADGTTLDRAAGRGLDVAAALRGHDTHRLLERLGDLFRTGPTGNNVADWAFAVRL